MEAEGVSRERIRVDVHHRETDQVAADQVIADQVAADQVAADQAETQRVNAMEVSHQKAEHPAEILNHKLNTSSSS